MSTWSDGVAINQPSIATVDSMAEPVVALPQVTTGSYATLPDLHLVAQGSLAQVQDISVLENPGVLAIPQSEVWAVDSQQVLPLLSQAIFLADEWFVGGKVTGGTGAISIYAMKGWDTDALVSVYWLSMGTPDLSPDTTIPALVGGLINARVMGVTN